MNLPYPFDKASGTKTNPDGSISLIDDQGNSLARIPMTTAFELSPEVKGHGDDDGSGQGYGCGQGSGSGYGYGVGYSGYGYGKADDDGSGRSK